MPILTFRADQKLEKMLDTITKKRGTSRSETIRTIIWENIDQYQGLSELEREYADLRQKRHKDNMQSEIVSHKMKKATYLNYVRSQVLKLQRNGAKKQEVIQILKAMMPIAERRNKLGELQEYLEAYRKGETIEQSRLKGEESPYES